MQRERALKDEEDVRAILRFTEVDIEAVRQRARKDSTLLVLEGSQPTIKFKFNR